MMNNKVIIEKIRELIPEIYSDVIVEIHPDGSNRSFYRIKTHSESYIVMYNPEPGRGNQTDENATFIYIQKLLSKNCISVPDIICCSDDKSIIILQDLGDRRLQEHLYEQGFIPDLIEKILRSIYKIGRTENIDQKQLFNPEYTSSFIFEHECIYFFNQFIRRFHKDLSIQDKLRTELFRLSARADSFSRKGLMHRDMQSRNIMIKDGDFYFIDFQGARQGHRAYDFASFIFDAYTEIYPYHYDTMLDMISGLLDGEGEETEGFLNEFKFIAVYRLMQMLGAFCSLYFNKQKEFFGKFIYKTCHNLYHYLKICQFDGIRYLPRVLRNIGDEYPTCESMLFLNYKKGT